jgi:SCP-2 sterol transfer family
VRYLSPEWMAAAGRALAADAGLGAALAGLDVVICQEVTGAPAGDITWHVTVGEGVVRLVPGPPEDPADLRFRTDYATAAAIAAGELPAPRAFVEGRLRIGGDLSLLVAHQRTLAAVDDALAGVRAATTY